MDIQLNFSNIRSETIGPDHGLTDATIDQYSGSIQEILRALGNQRQQGDLGYLELPYQDDLARDIERTANEITDEFDTFVILGIGGSALGGIALQRALRHPFYNQLSSSKRDRRPHIYFVDNIDPDTHSGLFDILDLRKTCFNIISKSGTTAEINAQLLIFLERLRKEVSAKQFSRHVVATTDATSGNLRKIVLEEKLRSFSIPDNVGGRFSVMTPVGLLPAAVAGIDIHQLLAGGKRMDSRCRTPQLWENPAAFNACVHHALHTQHQKSISVIMAYSDALYSIADWYCQLWAESLGKKTDIDGNDVFTGQTPVKALGATDQHSQLQLYIEGPNDKIVTLLGVQNYRTHMPIPQQYDDIPDIAYLSGHSLNELLQAEQTATATALMKNSRPNITLTLPTISEFTVGQVLYMYMVQTSIAGALYRINPYDQPGVEQGKQFAYGMLGRKGFEHKRQEIEAIPAPDKKYLF